jgi:hypothetical protein
LQFVICTLEAHRIPYRLCSRFLFQKASGPQSSCRPGMFFGTATGLGVKMRQPAKGPRATKQQAAGDRQTAAEWEWPVLLNNQKRITRPTPAGLNGYFRPVQDRCPGTNSRVVGIHWREVLHGKIETTYFQCYPTAVVGWVRREAKNFSPAVHKTWFTGEGKLLREHKDAFKFLAYLQISPLGAEVNTLCTYIARFCNELGATALDFNFDQYLQCKAGHPSPFMLPLWHKGVKFLSAHAQHATARPNSRNVQASCQSPITFQVLEDK